MSNIRESSASNEALWTGRLVSGFVSAFMVLDGGLHLVKPAPVVQAFHELGFPISLSVTLGIIELLCVLVYLYPRTSVLGAILLTGYLGGAVAMQLRVGHPLFGETLFPVYIGILFWGGLYLREPGLRCLIPIAESAKVAEENSPSSLPHQLSAVQL